VAVYAAQMDHRKGNRRKPLILLSGYPALGHLASLLGAGQALLAAASIHVHAPPPPPPPPPPPWPRRRVPSTAYPLSSSRSSKGTKIELRGGIAGSRRTKNEVLDSAALNQRILDTGGGLWTPISAFDTCVA